MFLSIILEGPSCRGANCGMITGPGGRYVCTLWLVGVLEATQTADGMVPQVTATADPGFCVC